MSRWIVTTLALAAAVACHDGALAPPPQTPTTVSGYVAIELGTLGGWSATPVAFNDRGQVVGYSDRVRVSSDGPERESRAFLWEDSTMYDLALLPGGTSMAEAINGLGQIAGRRNPGHPADTRAFVWDNLTPRDLDARAGAVPQQVLGINDQGDVLALEFAELLGFGAVLWRTGSRQDLPHLHPDGQSIPRALSRGGLAVGLSYVYERGSPYDFFHPVLWDNGQVTDLGVLSGGTCPTAGPVECGHGAAIDVNGNGVVVGWSNTASFATRAFRWENGVLTELGGLPGQPMWAWAINDRGQIAGDWGSSPVGGFLWDSGVTRDLGSLGGGGTHVRALSEDGQVVGSSLTAAGGQHAFVWRNGQMTDLGLGPSPIGAQASVAIAINARGDILGLSGNCSRNWDGSCNLVWPMRGILWRRLAPS